MASHKRSKKDGVSLAKGPVALLGAAMLAFGIIAFLLGGNGFDASPPSGDVQGDTFLGLEGNGWTNLLWAAGGALLLFGSPFHWGAKTLAMIVGLALGAASVIAMFDGFGTGDVLGVFATNSSTILALGAVSAALLLSSLLPKVGKGRHAERDDRAERPVARERTQAASEPRATEHDADGTHDHHDGAERPAMDRDAMAARGEEGRFDREATRGGIVDPQVRAAQDAERPR